MTRILGACGAVAAALAMMRTETVIGGLAWSLAVIAACTGYGAMFARLTRQRATWAVTALVGLAVLLAMSTVLARVGVLGRGVQLGAIAGGLVACIAVPYAPTPSRVPTAIACLVCAAGVLLVTVALVQDTALVGDGANHVLVVKRLWDTGALAIHHQAGAQIVGESYFALVTGAQNLSVFDEGACAMLLLALLATELASRDDEFGLVLLFALAIPIVLHPPPTLDDLGVWATVAFEVAMVLTLRDALAARRPGWLVVPLALGMICLRHEYVVLALPFPVAALVLPTRDRLGTRAIAIAALVWSIGLVAMQLGYRIGLGRAIVQLAAILLAVPLAFALRTLLTNCTWRSALGVLAFAMVSASIAYAVHAISPSFRAPSSLRAIWYAAAIVVVMQIDPSVIGERGNGTLRPLAAAFVLVLVVAVTTFESNLVDVLRDRTRTRLSSLPDKLAQLRDFALSRDAHDDVRALQDQVPAGARVAFWGQSAAQLAFQRNPIVDVSWPADLWRTEYFLSAIARPALAHTRYLIIETMVGRPEQDPWGSGRASATSWIADKLEPVAVIGAATLYRVR